MNENPVDKAKKVAAKHIGNVYDYLWKELKDLVPQQKILDICFAISDELGDTAVDVGNIYIAHEDEMIERIKDSLIQNLK